MTDQEILRVTDLKKYFGKVHAVDGINLSVKQGEIYGFLGPNGAGKTTTIGIILGLLYPTAGKVTLFGEPVTPMHTFPLRRIGALVGAPGLTPYLSARKNLELLATLVPSLDPKRIDEILEKVGLSEAANRKAGRFSTGMKQRLGLAMALLHNPELLILDEPTNGMDPAGMRDVRVLLRDLASQGVTIFLSSHLLHEVEQICTRVAVINQGKIVAEGSVSELLEKKTVVRVRVPSPVEAAAVLLTLPGAKDIQPNGNYVTIGNVPAQDVVGHLASHGIMPSEVTSGNDLESLFLALIEKEN